MEDSLQERKVDEVYLFTKEQLMYDETYQVC